MMKNVIVRIFRNIVLTVFSLVLWGGCAKQPDASQEEPVAYFFENDQQSDVFKVQVNGREVPVTVIPGVDAEEAGQIAERYKQLPSYCWIASRYITVHYAHLAVGVDPTVEIRVNESIRNYIIYPKRLKLKTDILDSTLQFTAPVDQSKYLLISVNELPLLVLIIEPLEMETPDPNDQDVVSLTEFTGGQADIGDYTDVFRRAIGQLNGTGKILYIPAGEYLTDEIQIFNCKDLSIYLSPATLIRIKTSPAGENIQNKGFWIENSENIRIYGRGCLDHQGYENFKEGRNDYHYNFPGYDWYFKFEPIDRSHLYLQSPVMIIHSKNITIEGITIRNSRNYNFNARHSDNIVAREVKILTPAGSVPENTDGINVGSIHGLLIENCLVYCNDDPFAFGHNLLPYDNRSIENVTVRGMVAWNPRANGVRLGWAMNTYAGDVLFENCDFSGMDDATVMIHKHSSNGKEPTDSLCYATVRFQNCTFDDVAGETQPMIEVQSVCMKSLEFVDCVFDAAPPIKPRILGDETRKIGRLLLENVIIGGKKLTHDNFDWETKNIDEIVIK